ncbi:MAG: 16S rRNA (guanine1516-N2)-methyltransferase [Porticoccaceae bacterium]|jgi:16S rRNA (guanine1516-N2)-methyltransferase
MTSWTTPNIVALLEGASPLMQQWMEASGVTQAASASEDDWVLKAYHGNLAIVRPDGVSQSVDFTKGKSRHRTKEAGAGATHLKKSLGISAFKKRHSRLPAVIDATGGWGQDTWAIASLGCSVTVMEKHPIVCAILACGLAYAALDQDCADIEERITLINQDACLALSNMHADVIYLDPMYPHRGRKKADSKKGMQVLQALLGPSDERLSAALLDAALSSAASRVVVKRPKGAEAIEAHSPHTGQRFVIESPNTRYDVYQQATSWPS